MCCLHLYRDEEEEEVESRKKRKEKRTRGRKRADKYNVFIVGVDHIVGRDRRKMSGQSTKQFEYRRHRQISI